MLKQFFKDRVVFGILNEQRVRFLIVSTDDEAGQDISICVDAGDCNLVCLRAIELESERAVHFLLQVTHDFKQIVLALAVEVARKLEMNLPCIYLLDELALVIHCDSFDLELLEVLGPLRRHQVAHSLIGDGEDLLPCELFLELSAPFDDTRKVKLLQAPLLLIELEDVSHLARKYSGEV